ncbi:hypothetical protein GCM10010172_48810 [Paractinoplanes ferrugineus]|uniref:Uncharacterized protein n=1 Tax=Paractinoplanes ferrugineus TaxID=113564 RepID=A0A919J0B0_9ACTN|nr:hypothetical protein [Actinoplanes ferrugineus]GIE11142.1 hypothetical protein Afe05nite_29820 [Actinoplanes ferrugineus]
MVVRRPARARRLAVLALAAVALGLLMVPAAAPAAGSISASAQGLRTMLIGLANTETAKAAWSAGAAVDNSVSSAGASGIVSVGAVQVSSGPADGGTGGAAAADVASVGLIGAVNTGAVHSACKMTASQITGVSTVAALKVGSAAKVDVNASTTVSVSNVLSVDLNKQSATWDSGDGTLTYRVQALDVSLLPSNSSGLTLTSEVVVGESVCSGKVRLGPVRATPVVLAPGQTDTPTVSVTNTGDAAAPNTVLTVPVPPAGYTLGTPTATNGGTCTKDSTKVTCAGITVPAGSTATVSLPVTLSSSASANDWAPTSGIDAVSTPVAAVTGTTIESRGSGTLATTLAGADVDLAGGVSIIPAGATPGGAPATASVRVTNSGTSTAAPTTITVPAPPTGYTVGAVSTSGGGTCTTAGAITCTGVTVPAGGTIAVSIPVTVATGVSAAWTADSGLPVIATSGGSTGIATGPIVTTGAGLAVTVTGPADGTLSPGDTGTLTVTATNGGGTAAAGVQYAFLAPTNTTFVAPVPGYCAVTSSTRVDCTMNVAAHDYLQFPLPIKVALAADPATPLTGGCADAGHDGTCTVPPDVKVKDIRLKTSLSGKVTIGANTVTIVPGDSGNGVVRIHSAVAIAATTVTIPLSALPTGFHLTKATGPNGSLCVLTTSKVTCAAVPLVAGSDSDITLATSVDTGVALGTVWHATGIRVSADPDFVTGSADPVQTPSAAADVTFTVTGPTGPVAPGSATSLTVTGVNSGTAAANNRTASVKAPANATFGPLTGATATACQVTTSTQVTCTYSLAAGGSLTWTLPLTVSPAAKTGDKVANGCVTADGNTTCGGSQDVDAGAVPLATHGKLVVAGSVVAPGDTGTAGVTMSATADYADLVLTVPLDDLPSGFTVRSAAIGSAPCTVGESSVVCTGVALTAGTARNLRLSVSVDAAVPAAATWRVNGVVLARAADPTDRVTAAGTLISTSAGTFTVSVAVGGLSVAAPTPGQTTLLPITVTDNGPGEADPYPVTIMIPDGTTPGTAPGNCVEGSTDRTVTCTVSLSAGESATIMLPLVIDTGLAAGTIITGGCVDQALGTGTPAFDYTCGGATDVAIPDFTVGQLDVDLAVTYGGGTVPLAGSSRPVVKIPYSNGGTTMAADVAFTIEPPVGVWITRAQVVLNSASQGSASSRGSAQGSARGPASGKAVAGKASMVDATCVATLTGKENDVTCEAPDAAANSGHELWLTLKVGSGVRNGTQGMTVTVTTTSDDGIATNNTVQVPLELAAQDTDTDTELPTTGTDVVHLAVMSTVLVALGVMMIIGVRDRRPRPAGAAHGVRKQAEHEPRHARPKR